MFIKDFIEQYTPGEIEKIRRKDVVGKFQNKTLLQKVAHDQSIRSLETTPICTKIRQMTPRAPTAYHTSSKLAKLDV
jgi:hypothetical protein